VKEITVGPMIVFRRPPTLRSSASDPCASIPEAASHYTKGFVSIGFGSQPDQELNRCRT
jgi:hypothetical protein